MNAIQFTKMQGAGNDYVYISCFDQHIENPAELAIQVSNRNFGIGSDGLVLILPSKICDFRMQMFNADGTEAEMCGNASRCIAKYVYDNKLTAKTELSLETKAGVKRLFILESDLNSRKIKVDMGEPILAPQKIPTTFFVPVLKQSIAFDNEIALVTAISIGNPHAVIFIEDGSLNQLDIARIGSKIENHPIFPQKTNVEFIEIVNRNEMNMRVWERGTGETLACGTGACASVVAGVLNALTERRVTVHLKGGDLFVEWNEKDDHVYMTGEAVTVFEGTLFIRQNSTK